MREDECCLDVSECMRGMLVEGQGADVVLYKEEEEPGVEIGRGGQVGMLDVGGGSVCELVVLLCAAIHACVVRARLEDGPLLRWMVGEGGSEIRRVGIPACVEWSALELWLEELYTGSADGVEGNCLSRAERGSKGLELLRPCLDPLEEQTLLLLQDDEDSPSGKISSDAQGDNQLLSTRLQQDLADLFSMAPGVSLADIRITLQTHDGSEKEVYAHKSILANRSSYFGAMEDVSKSFRNPHDPSIATIRNVLIHIERVPLAVAVNVIKFLYTGVISVPPDQVSYLLLIANQWCLDELRMCILQHLRNQTCWSFQKPEGSKARLMPINIMQVLQLCDSALQYGLPDVDEEIKSLKADSIAWLSNWSKRCWVLKEFALLPKSIHQEILEATVQNLRVASCVQLFMNCNQILATLPSVAWARSTLALATNLNTTVSKYILDNISSVSRSKLFRAAMLDDWHKDTGEDLRQSLTDNLSTDTTVGIVCTLHDMLHQQQDDIAPDKDDSAQSVLLQAYSDAQSYASKNFMAIIRSGKFRALDEAAKQKFTSCVKMLDPDRTPAREMKNGNGGVGTSFVVLNSSKSHQTARQNFRKKE